MISRLPVLAILACLVVPAVAQDKSDAAKPKEVVTYKDHVSPILRKHCGNCHNPDKATSDFNVMTYQTLMAGGSSGEAIAAGSPDSSRLYKAVAHIEEPFMPPKAPKIPEADLAVIKKWIELGAPETSVSAAKNATRKVDLDLASVSTGKPDVPPMPEKLPEVSLPHTKRPHPVTALAAVRGHRSSRSRGMSESCSTTRTT